MGILENSIPFRNYTAGWWATGIFQMGWARTREVYLSMQL